MSRFVILAVVAAISLCPAIAKGGGILNSSYEEVAAVFGQPSSHDHGKVSSVEYDRYHFETKGWKTAVLFIDSRAQKFETEKGDGSPLSAEEQTAILDSYDLPNTTQNSSVRGWRELGDNHLIRRDGRVHVIKHLASMIVFLDDLPRDFW